MFLSSLLVGLLGFAPVMQSEEPAAQDPPSKEPAVQEVTAQKPKAQEPADGKRKAGKKDKPKAEQQEPDEKARDRGRRPGRYGESGRGPKNGDPRRWWDQMSPEEREEAKARWKRYRDMSPDSKAELDRRLEMLKRETEQMMLELPAEEREKLAAMGEEERNRKIHRMLRKRMKDRAAAEGHPPGPPPEGDLGNLPLEERLQGSKKQMEEMRLHRLQREVDRAVHEGWLGPKAAEFYRTLPPEEVEQEMMRFHKWRVLDHFAQGNKWKELGIDDAERKRITALPPKEFMEHMRKYRPKRGERRGPRGRRGEGPPPKDGEAGLGRPKRGEARGDGREHPQRGDGRRRGPRDGGRF